MSNQLIREDAALLWHWKGICGTQAWNLDGDPMSRPLGWIGAMLEMDWDGLESMFETDQTEGSKATQCEIPARLREISFHQL